MTIIMQKAHKRKFYEYDSPRPQLCVARQKEVEAFVSENVTE